MNGSGQQDIYRLLLVDDNPAIHEDIRKILALDPDQTAFETMSAELFGDSAAKDPEVRFEIDSAYQGQEALAQVQQAVGEGRPYALALVDMRMPPGWDGLETITRIWREDPDIQVVICSAYSDHPWSEISDRLAPGDRLLILKKPFDSVEIRQLAHTLSRKWALAREVQQQITDLDDLVELRTQELQDANEKLRCEATQLKEMELELRLAQKLEAIGQLAAGIAHEINTPTQYVGDNVRFLQDAFAELLKLVQTYAGLLEGARAGPLVAELIVDVEQAVEAVDLDYLVEEMPKAIEQALEGLQQIAKIVGAMKEFSHPGSGDKEVADLKRIIENTLIVTRNEWKYVAEVVTDFDEDLTAVQCFPGELGQVFLNMIINAVHAINDVVGDGSEAKGTITISARQLADVVEIRIGDTGTGVPEALRAKVFDPFFTTKEVGKGTGQGLAIARSVIVDKHHGSITLESECDRGTTFVIQLPVDQETAGQGAAAAETVAPA